ncbi:hypothetical protein [Paenibacillus vulneris]|uniref:Uncharacterized protein n=1 Tax=Paenibacillus vulneris TaxID=1133364 RepID=A0ABW3ULT1_9BACL
MIIVPDKQILKREQPSPLFAYPDAMAEIAATIPADDLNVVETMTNSDEWGS